MNALRSCLFLGLCALGIISNSALAQSATYIVEAVAPASGTISPGQTVTVEVFMDNVTDLAAPTPDLVAAYQVILEIVPGAGRCATIRDRRVFKRHRRDTLLHSCTIWNRLRGRSP